MRPWAAQKRLGEEFSRLGPLAPVGQPKLFLSMVETWQRWNSDLTHEGSSVTTGNRVGEEEEQGEEEIMMMVVLQSCVQPCIRGWVDVSAPRANGGLAPGSLEETRAAVPKTKCILVT